MQYRYNQNDQIESTSFGGLYPQTELFDYDSNLNIREQTRIPGEAQGALHQLSQQQQAGRVVRRTTAKGYQDYHYDLNGRLARKVEHQHGFRPREWRYQWDTLNQLISCFTPRGDCWRYTYDAFGRRLSKYQVVDTQEPIHLRHLNLPPVIRGWQYLWSGNQMIEEAPVYADGTVAYESGIQWLYEPGALTPAARYEKGKLHYLVTDHQGTPREIFTETGTVSWAARPDTWGQMAFWGLKTSANDPNYTECHFRFAGQYEDAETGLYYNRFRYYDRETGQYISPDPIGLQGGLNPYGYVHCPVGWVDPFGLAGSSLLDQIVNDANKVASPGGEITAKQAEILRGNLPVIQRRSVFQNQMARKEFVKNQNYLVKQWELNTGRVWPTNATPHHILPLESGGANKWWNLMPTNGTLPNHSLPGVPGPHATGGVLRTTIQQGRKSLPPGTETDLRL